jgi:hypothetical protein
MAAKYFQPVRHLYLASTRTMTHPMQAVSPLTSPPPADPSKSTARAGIPDIPRHTPGYVSALARVCRDIPGMSERCSFPAPANPTYPVFLGYVAGYVGFAGYVAGMSGPSILATCPLIASPRYRSRKADNHVNQMPSRTAWSAARAGGVPFRQDRGIEDSRLPPRTDHAIPLALHESASPISTTLTASSVQTMQT